MARDRQRSKARQRARAAQEKRGRRPRRSDAPDINAPETDVGLPADDVGLPTDDVEQSGLVAPGMEHSSAEVDIAKAAEAGAQPLEPEPQPAPEPENAVEEEHDYGPERSDRAPDELELPADLRPAKTARRIETPDSETDAPAPTAHKDRSRIVTFLQGCIEELRRVQWPDRPQVFQATAVVLGFVLIAGGYLGLMDAIWQPLINAIL